MNQQTRPVWKGRATLAGILGETITARTTHDYAHVLAALIANATARAERDALADLPPGLNVPVTDINGSRDDSSVTLGTANDKALGLGTGLDVLRHRPHRGGHVLLT